MTNIIKSNTNEAVKNIKKDIKTLLKGMGKDDAEALCFIRRYLEEYIDNCEQEEAYEEAAEYMKLFGLSLDVEEDEEDEEGQISESEL